MTDFASALNLFESYDLLLVVLGLSVLGLATLPRRIEQLPVSFPILVLASGYVAFALPLGLRGIDAREEGVFAVHLTEIGVILSLMGVGLKIDRMPHWRTWSTTWRLLAVCMPLTIAGVALLGWWMLGLAPAAAVLLGASMAPTDPVLASDVQVGEPEKEIPEDSNPADRETASRKSAPEEKEDELRFALTSEAGLNDALAFPFTYLALLMLTAGVAPENWLSRWLLVDVGYRIFVGVVAGVALGRGLAVVFLRLPLDSDHDKMKAGVTALAGTLLLYGVTEVLGGYGFLAVFLGGLTIRHRERTHPSHKSLHLFAEQSEQLVMTGVLIALGGAIAGGLLAPLTWEAALVGVLLVFVVRPAAAMIGLLGERRLPLLDKGIVSFFGIRGIGCLYYLAFGVEEGTFAEEDLLWATCAFTVVLSVCVHGVMASPVMRFRDRHMAPASAPPRKTLRAVTN